MFKIKKNTKETKLAIEDAYVNAEIDWLLSAEKILWGLCRKRKFVTSDDVLTQLEYKGKHTHNNSALGGVFMRAKNNGWIKPHGFTQSRRRSRHSAPVRVWQSLVNKEDKNAI